MGKVNELLSLDVNSYTQKKGRLTYLSWANAWKEFIKIYPKATYKIKRKENGDTWFGNGEIGYMVYTEVTAGEITHEMFLPVMDYKNKSMLKPTTFDINKAIMRCLTKNLAMFGLGLYIYAGEDLPEEDVKEIEPKQIKRIHTLASKFEDPKKIKGWYKGHYKVKSTKDLTFEQAKSILNTLDKKLKKQEDKK